MLMGTYQNSIDTKNRFIVPAKFRDELGLTCVITKGLDNCLVIYPMETWMQQQALYAKLPRSDEQVRSFLRYTYQNAFDCEVDKQGRTVLPAYLREMAGIKKELVTIGMIDRIEIWAKEIYDNNETGGRLSSDSLKSFSEKYQV